MPLWLETRSVVPVIRELQSQGLRLALNVETAGAQLQISLVAQGLGLGLVPRAALAASPFADQAAFLAALLDEPTRQRLEQLKQTLEKEVQHNQTLALRAQTSLERHQ